MEEAFRLLAEKFEGFEDRPGQIEMARAVERALAAEEHLCVEAPCGIGKTFAYLVPAIRRAIETEKPAVVCTANIALQEQLMEKDLPALAEILPEKFSYALIKGMNNYLCLDRFRDAQEELLLDKDELKDFQRIREWASDTVTGDRSELDFEPAHSVWSAVNGVSELCTTRKCPRYEECHIMRARRRLHASTVIVSNYHLLFAHLKIRMAAERDAILPPFDLLICDEAHEMADVARDFFGMKLTPWSIVHLVRAANAIGMSVVADTLRRSSRAFFDDVAAFARSGRYGLRIREPGFADGAPLMQEVQEFRRDLHQSAQAAATEEEGDKLAKYLTACENYAGTLQAFLDVDDENQVYWIESGEKSAARLVSAVVDASAILKAALFERTSSVILTSATLTAGGKFDFLRSQTGLDSGGELVVPSPFDFGEQCRVVVPAMKSRPNDAGYAKEVSAGINRILGILGGKTLCLFTSYRSLNLCAEEAEGLGVKILRQGDMPRTKLLEKFRKGRKSALFATASFWQGVDVPGEALSCLVIDRIPFTPPDEPLLSALQERDPSCFTTYSLPRAILELRQGFGRLIRRRDDRGVVVIFDPRLYTARYGSEILRSLPRAPITRTWETLETFFPPKKAKRKGGKGRRKRSR